MLRTRPARVRVGLVGRDPLARQGLAALLAQDDDVELVGQADGEGDPAVIMLPGATAPDVTLWDLGTALPESVRSMERAAARGAVVALVEDEESGSRAGAAGARGVLYRDASAQAVLVATRAVAMGLVVHEPAILLEMLPSRAEVPDAAQVVESLTPREREVLGLVVQGLTNRAIAERLGISAHTAKFHVTQVMGKLGATRRAEVAVRASRLGWISL